MIAISSGMFHELQSKNVLNGSFRVKAATFSCKYEGKEEIGEEILFSFGTGATALVKMKIISVEKQDEKQESTLQYLIFAHFDLIRVIDKSGEVPDLCQDEKIVKKF